VKNRVELSRHNSPGTDGRFLSQKVVVNGWAGTSWGREEMVPPQGLPHWVSGEAANVSPRGWGDHRLFPRAGSGGKEGQGCEIFCHPKRPQDSEMTVNVELLATERRLDLA